MGGTLEHPVLTLPRVALEPLSLSCRMWPRTPKVSFQGFQYRHQSSASDLTKAMQPSSGVVFKAMWPFFVCEDVL